MVFINFTFNFTYSMHWYCHPVLDTAMITVECQVIIFSVIELVCMAIYLSFTISKIDRLLHITVLSLVMCWIISKLACPNQIIFTIESQKYWHIDQYHSYFLLKNTISPAKVAKCIILSNKRNDAIFQNLS